jgi:hypothetical protein
MSAKLDKLAKELRDVRGPLEATALRGKKIFEASAAGAGVLGHSIAGKRKAVGVRYDINRASKAAGQATAVITYTGPAHLVNNPTSPHVIAAKRLGLSRRRSTSRAARQRDATLAFGGSARGLFGSLAAASRTTRSGAVRSGGAAALTIGPDLRAFVRHPGTRGKGFFQRARQVSEVTLPQVYGRAQLTDPLRRIF